MKKLNELERLIEQSTPGPWEPNIYCGEFFLSNPREGKFVKSKDLELIEAMRDNIVALIRVAKAAVVFERITSTSNRIELLNAITELDRGNLS
jgi:hypothetical protein